MTLAELHALDPLTLWQSLSKQHQATIGAAAVKQELCLLVAQDDGSDTTADDRKIADDMANRAMNFLTEAVETSFPQIQWWSE